MVDDPKRTSAERGDDIPLAVEWGDSSDVPTAYANQFVISHFSTNEFYLLFGELSPPMYPDLKAAFAAGKLKDPIVIKPVARIVVSPESMKAIAKAITQNVEKFEKRLANDP